MKWDLRAASPTAWCSWTGARSSKTRRRRNSSASRAASAPRFFYRRSCNTEALRTGRTFTGSRNQIDCSSRKQRHLLEPQRLGKAEHEVHVLHGLPGSALGKIVERRADDGAALDAIVGHPDEDHVAAAHMPGLRHFA